MLAKAITGGVMLIALATASPATGGSERPKTFEGLLERGGEISFRLNGGNPRTVDRISITDIPIECKRGSGAWTFRIFGDTPVLDDRTFAVRSEDDGGRRKALVEGRFSRSFAKAKGAARVWGRFPDPSGAGRIRCNSGWQEFAAG